jgi:2-amino-4-hydroxy-6-hydroxymethyldihydropteridine diphosphokinase
VQRTAYIALGSNLPSLRGSPAETLQAAVDRLGSWGCVLAQSSLYETDPVGYLDQPAFLNAAVALKTELSPDELLRRMLSLERDFGREREPGIANGPRTLDLDLLLVDDLAIVSPGLTLPHPALACRRFVLAPLAEIAPLLRHPIFGRTVAELLEVLPDSGENRIDAVRRVEPAGWKGPSSDPHATRT